MGQEHRRRNAGNWTGRRWRALGCALELRAILFDDVGVVVADPGWRMSRKARNRPARPDDDGLIEELGLSAEEAEVVRAQLELADMVTSLPCVEPVATDPQVPRREPDQSADRGEMRAEPT
ncbi:MAG: hypothetical protein ACRELX_10275, partial [Longimicrobiales bacterium]